MAKPVIAIDIDDVLADNAAGFVAFSNEKWDTNLRPEDYEENWSKMWAVDYAETERRTNEFNLHRVGRTYRHRDEALPVLTRLSVDYSLRIITSRRLQAKGDTLEWIHYHYPGIFKDDDIFFAGIWDTIDDQSAHKTKADIVTGISATYLIDDQLKHCLAAAQTGAQALLFGDYKWNQIEVLPENVSRMVDWSAVEGYFYG